MNYNKVILMGNVGKDPVIHTFDDGGKKATFSLATTETWKGKDGEKKEQTHWHNIVASGPVVDVIEQYVKKGSAVHIDGKLTYRDYESKEGGKRSITEIKLLDLQLLSRPKQSAETGQSPAPQQATVETDTTDDLPF